MADLSGFDANQVDPTNDYDPLPSGKYLAVAIDSELKPNRAGTGHYLQFTFQVLDGPHKGRYVWARLNLHHPNPTAVQIARAELSALCRAVGVLAPTDSSDLHDIPLVIHVRLRKRTDGDGLTNEIRGFSPRPPQNGVATPAVPPTPTPQPALNGRAATPPWKR